MRFGLVCFGLVFRFGLVLQTESGFAGRIGQGGDAPMITIVTAVEGDFLDAGRKGLFSEQLADGFSRGLVAAIGHVRAHIFILRAHGDEGFAGDVVNDLASQIAMAAINRQAWTGLGATSSLANAILSPLTLTTQVFVFIHGYYLC